MKIDQNVFVVTGGGNGVGRELVLELLSRGARVAAIDINQKGLQETKDLAGERSSRVSVHVVDITDVKQVSLLPQQVINAHGQVDAIINNAGIIQPFKSVLDLDLESAQRVMKVNYNGTLLMTKTFLPLLLKRPQAHVANVSSMGGFFPVSGQVVYGASKAAVKLFTEGLHSELRGSNCNVTVIIPGSIGTGIIENSGQKLNQEMEALKKTFKGLSPSKAARIMINGIEKKKSRIYVGYDSKLLNISERLFTGLASRIFAKLIGSKLVD